MCKLPIGTFAFAPTHKLTHMQNQKSQFPLRFYFIAYFVTEFILNEYQE